MKKLLITLLMLSLIFFTGCTDISKENVDDILSSVLYLNNNLNNTFMDGYSMYLPKGVKILDKTDFNLVLKDNDSIYYVYMDVIAYHYKTKNDYQVDNSHFLSKKIDYNGIEGYLDIREENDKYYVVLEYNYAKIESVIKKDDLKKTLVVMSSLLSSIRYNDSVIDGFVGEASYKFQEEKFNIFKKEKNDDNFLKYESEFGTYKDEIIINNDDVIDIEDVIE